MTTKSALDPDDAELLWQATLAIAQGYAASQKEVPGLGPFEGPLAFSVYCVSRAVALCEAFCQARAGDY